MTLWPGSNSSTSSPTDSTKPAPSWPRMAGKAPSGSLCRGDARVSRRAGAECATACRRTFPKACMHPANADHAVQQHAPLAALRCTTHRVAQAGPGDLDPHLALPGRTNLDSLERERLTGLPSNGGLASDGLSSGRHCVGVRVDWKKGAQVGGRAQMACDTPSPPLLPNTVSSGAWHVRIGPRQCRRDHWPCPLDHCSPCHWANATRSPLKRARWMIASG